MTCAPATLAAIAAYWRKDHDHLTIANAICHEGTPWHKERQWAEENGFDTREFRLTADAVRALIDRGVPFTLTTQAATSAHLQTCTGYDERIGIIYLRDPTERHFGEMILEDLIQQHPIDGPRCMVLIPQEEAHRLGAIDLPDAAAYDAHHDLLVALDGHDRWKVEAGRSTLRAVAPAHPLVHKGEERMAAWLQDWPRHLAAIDAQLAWTRGKPKRLRKKRGLSNPRNAHKPFYDREVKSPLWLIVLIIIVLVRGCLLVIEK
ncbi:MAG: C39 family peptidase [Akkermansiaceae bacterium]|nr:C39 family peptidase [Akkermansiaceae bacterium]